MNFALNNTNHYLDQLKAHTHDQQIIHMAEELLADARTHGELIPLQIKVTRAQKKYLPTLQKIIMVAYNGRYGNQDEQTANFGETGSGDHIATYMATHTDDHGHELILGTLRLVRDQLELFDFFTLLPGKKWRCQQEKLTPYEFERLAFHPAVDVIHDLHLRQYIVRQIIHTALASLDPQTSWVACTMNDKVARFIADAGIHVELITDATLADNQQIQYLKSHWPNYFTNVHAYEVHR